MSHRTIVVGLGNVGLGYDIAHPSGMKVRTHARAFHLHDKFMLVGGVDPSLSAQKMLEDSYSCKAFGDLRTALLDLIPDIIVIATPTEQHLQDVQTTIEVCSPKAILCEKPLAYNRTDGAEIIELCESKDIELYVNYIRLTDPAVIEIKARLDASEIETPVKGIAWYSKGFLHNGSHFFNLLTYWLGDVLSSKVIQRGKLLDYGDCEVDARVEFQGGTIDFLAVPDGSIPHSAIELLSPSGRLIYRRGGLSIVWYSARDIAAHQGEIIPSGLSKYQLHVADHLANALEDKPHNLCNGARAFKTVERICEINKAH